MRTRRVFILLLILIAPWGYAQPADVSRVLRTFDFEERRLGNVEDLPMDWVKVEGDHLPHYVNGRLASDHVHGGAYSFRLDLNGGGLIYRYDSGRIKVQPGAHYRVDAHVRTTVLPHARARMSAYFTDVDHRPIEASRVHSELYAARREGEGWKRMSVELSAGEAEAAYLVIELGLLQPAHYAPSTLGQHTLHAQDIRGVAWFDDVSVSQVPRVTMTTERPGNVFRRSDPLRLTVVVNDRFTDDLAAQLVIHDATGRGVYQRSGALDMTAAQELGPGRKRMTLELPDLPPGWYRAGLVMTSHGQYVGEQTLDLVHLADAGEHSAPDGRFGLIATDLPFEGWTELPAILPALSAGRVKLSVWNETGDIQQIDPAGFDQLLESLHEAGITPTACLTAPPPEVAQKIEGTSWLHLLQARREDWQPQLAYLVSRHANHLDYWQLGPDGTDVFVSQPGMRQVYAMVYEEFAKLVQDPDLAMPWPAWYELDGRMPATVALSVPAWVLPSQLPLYVADLQTGERAAPAGSESARTAPELSLTLQLLDPEEYGRELQIKDLAQRVVYSLVAGAKRIDLPLPYRVRAERDGIVKQPQELLMIVRTLITVLGGSSYQGKVPIADGVEAFLFDKDGQGILVLWDRGNVAGVKQLALNLGQRPQRVDLWGNVTPLAKSPRGGSAASDDSATVALEVGPMPIFLIDIDGPQAQLRASVALDRPLVESSFAAHTRKLRFLNPYKSAVGGTLKLRAPQGWTLSPPTFNFTLNPGEWFEREITIEFPYNSFAGPKTIGAEFLVQGERESDFTVPIVIQLGLSDVGLQTLALRDGGDVLVQQMITNYGSRPIDYTAFAIYPGEARQERLVTNLGPGRTTIKLYRFQSVQITANSKVRSGVKELAGTRILNDEVPVQ